MTSRSMRKLPASAAHCASPRLKWNGTPSFPNAASSLRRCRSTTSAHSALHIVLAKRHLAQVRPEPLSEIWFTSFPPRAGSTDELLGTDDHKPPDERLVKLGKTLRTLSPLLPNILTHPLPQQILSPHISLHLFPSTHPHLPAVKGLIPYRAALWTAPVAWGSVPLVGSTKLSIQSEKVVRTGFYTPPSSHTESDERSGLSDEKLVVRFRTEPKINSTSSQAASSGHSSSTANINRSLSKLLGGDQPIFKLNSSDEFSGLFIFTFDDEGRIATHTIEHADENNGFDKTSKMVTLTDWLLGKAKWGTRKEQEMIPGLAMRVCREEWQLNGRKR